MKSAFTTTIALLALATVASARPPAAFEEAREVEPSLLTLPSAAGGQITYQKCADCEYRTYTLADTARFYIGKQQVSFAELKRYVAGHPKANMLVVNLLSENVVTRVVAQ